MTYELRTRKIPISEVIKQERFWLMSENLDGIEDSVIVVQCMMGYGDGVYTTIGLNAIYLALKEQYAASNIRKEPYFYAVTPLPQLFSHLPYVRCIKPLEVELRTQGKNAARKDLNRYWHAYPVLKEGGMIVKLAINYFERFGGDDHWSTPGNMLLPIISNAFMAWDLRRFPMEMTLPHFDVELPDWARKPFILLRENVIRKEWPASARNCNPKYLKAAIKILRQKYNYPIISIADVEPNQEWIENSCFSDYQYHKGEFNLEQMCELVHRATLCLGSQGWISPFAMAAKSNAIIILGGAGYENHPKRLTHEKLDTHTVKFIKPDNMCECKGIRHEGCNKIIINFEDKFNTALQELGM